jgi:ABC-2 type transport system ATP-binding protein
MCFRPRIYTERRRKEYLRSITLIMGQKQQLAWDLPPIETFLVNAAIYEIPDKGFKQTLGELTELLELGPLLKKQVRKLSLGERLARLLCTPFG